MRWRKQRIRPRAVTLLLPTRSISPLNLFKFQHRLKVIPKLVGLVVNLTNLTPLEVLTMEDK